MVLWATLLTVKVWGDGWTPVQGSWEVVGQRLATRTAGEEHWIWAGAPPVRADGRFQARLNMEFRSTPLEYPGRYAGIMFFAGAPTFRFDPAAPGYTIDWIDRQGDRGFRLIRWDRDSVQLLVMGTPDVTEPPKLWQLEVEGEMIRFLADGRLMFEVADGTYRTGYFGVWAYGNNEDIVAEVLSLGPPLEVTNTSDNGAGSLRQAMLDANLWPGPGTISFRLPDPAARLIAPLTPLPIITEPVVLDGSGSPGVVIHGAAAGTGADGLVIRGSNVTVRHLAIDAFAGHGIVLSNATGCVIQNCVVGADPDRPGTSGNGRSGLGIHGGGDNLIGGAPDVGNWIERNGGSGVRIRSANVLVPGFLVQNVSANAPVATLAAAEDALADPNRQTASHVERALTINYTQGSGGRFASDRPFPGFGFEPIDDDFVVEATGVLTIPAGGDWTFGVNSDDGFIGVVGTNVLGCDCVRGATVTLATWQMAAGDYPVRLIYFERAGGAELEFFAAPGRRLAFDDSFRLVGDEVGGGLRVRSAGGHAVRGNVIRANGQLALDLGDDGATANDAGDGDSGPNGLQNFPLLMPYTALSGATVVAGTLNSRSNTTYRLDFYASGECGASGRGEGWSHRGSTVVRTGPTGDVTFQATLLPMPVGSAALAATATDLAGNTSEFSPCAAAAGPGIAGTLGFSNTNPALLNLLNAPGNDGMKSYFVAAATRPPAAPLTATTPEVPAGGRTNTPYQITVTGSPEGIAYAVTPRVSLANGAESYYFNIRTSALVMANGPPVTLDFLECLGVVTVRFVDSAGEPTPVDGGQILVSGAALRRFVIAPGSTQARVYLRGDTVEPLSITVNRGSDPYRDRLTFMLSTNVLTICDGFRTVDMFVPEPGSLGRIEGEADMVGEFELAVDGSDTANLPDSTGLIALNGPFQNQRWAALPGNNATMPSSGAYVISNVAPSTLTPVPAAYAVYAQMYFRTNHAIEYFRSPALGSGSNASLFVGPGQVINLSNLFVIQPGYLRGTVTLQGPPEMPGHPSLFRGMKHASDLDSDLDGIPDLLGSFGVNWTSIAAEGVNRRAPGAAWTAAFGYANADFDGAVQATAGAFQGTYELVLGGLRGQAAYWSPRVLNLRWSHPAGPAAPDYFDNSLTLTDRDNPEVLIAPGQTVTRDVGYCFSEVRLVIQSAASRFYAPEVRATTGGFIGTDYRGRRANYGAALNVAAGPPTRAAEAATRAEVVMFLPQGNYRLLPSVIYTGNNQSRTGLSPIDITVGCQERIIIGDALHQLSVFPGPAGTVSFTLLTEPGRTYQVERATQLNPANWEPIGSPIGGTGDPVTVQQEIAAGEPQAFFRIRFNP